MERLIDRLVTQRVKQARITRVGEVTAVIAGPPPTVRVGGRTLGYEAGKTYAVGDRVVTTTGRDPVVLFKLA